LSIKKEGKDVIFNLYQKPTCSGRYLHYLSNHPWIHKRGIICGMVDKIINLTHPKFHQENITQLIHTLLDNGYPLNIIFDTIHKIINKHIIQNSTTTSKENTKDERRFFTIPYIKHFSEKYSKFRDKFKLAYSINNKLNNFIKTGKDKIEHMQQMGVVYHINCNNCDASYVGQTKRKLETRIKEHQRDINKKTGTLSTISLHRQEEAHEFDWENVKILDKEQSYSKRLTSEMLHIKRQKSPLNIQSDTIFFPENYTTIVNQFPI